LSGLEKLPVHFAEDFKTFASNISHKGLNTIQKTFTSNSFANSNAMMIVMNHPVLDLILDILKALEISELILIRSVFTTMIKVQQNIVIVLITELNELHDDMNPFSLPFLDQTHTKFP
jgi:H2-forming N5,N10-methylenetetrahydromethanopterin dehydrogenase-like enzyme